MRKIVSDNAITARPIDLLGLGALNGFTPVTSFQATGKNVLTTLTALAKSSNIGYRTWLDVPNKALIFETYQGTDKSVTQTARPYVLFSDEFHNITGPEYTLNTTGYANYAYVAGQGEGSARIVVTVDQTGGEPRRELWVDARDLRVENFSAAAVDTANFAYLTDWDLGDIVSFEKWGLRLDQRITEVEEVDEGGVTTITPVCGNPLPETLDLGSDT
jgi:hypothetical protein